MISLFFIVCAFFANNLIGPTASARILAVFPTPSISHQVVYHALMKDLANRGHSLTILTTDLINIQNPNVTQIDLHDTYDIFREINFADYKKKNYQSEDMLDVLVPVLYKVVDKQLSHPEVVKIIQKADNQTFDVLIIEHLNYASMLAFADIYDCPIIGITSFETLCSTHEDMGNEANPAILPDMVFPFSNGQLTFVERWRSIKYYLKSTFVLNPDYDRNFKGQIRKHFPSVKSSIETMRQRVQLLMTNTHPAMGFIRPLLPNTIQLGFMHLEAPKPLPNGPLKTFLDNSKNGVIYMSLGSNVKSKDLNVAILNIFLDVFRKINYNVLWKFEAENLPNKPDNVMISKWLPQSDLLAHPAIKLFITQGGQQSMEEAINSTIPMIVIPFMGDQDGNAKRMKELDIGYHLELHSLTQSKLDAAINEMLKPKYKENIRKLRELVNDQPMTSRERAVWWTEYVIRHKGAKHLQYPGRFVPFYQKYWLDFIGIMIAGIVFTFYILLTFYQKFSSKKFKND